MLLVFQCIIEWEGGRMAKENKRKKAVANPKVQYTLARRVVLHFFVFICAGAFFGVINQFLSNPFAGVKENLAAFAQQSAPFLLAVICLIPIFIRDTLTLSNRIAGPIHNMQNTIVALSEGQKDVRPLKFREGDFWDDLPAKFNKMTDTLRSECDQCSDAVNQTPATNQELVEA